MTSNGRYPDSIARLLASLHRVGLYSAFSLWVDMLRYTGMGCLASPGL